MTSHDALLPATVLQRKAVVYVRQSTPQQVQSNLESQRRQYELVDVARRRGFTNVVELDWWESVRLGEVALEFVPAHHWSRRTLTDGCKSLWGGWVFSSGDTKVYFAGDTGYGHWFGEIAARHPGLDLALLPVGAYEPNWFMKPVHMNPAEAVQACEDLGAGRMATMHWGTFVLSAEPLLDPVRKAAQAWAEAGRPREDLWDLAIGETRFV